MVLSFSTMADNVVSAELKQILELMHKQDLKHAADMQELRDSITDLRDSISNGGLNSKPYAGSFQFCKESQAKSEQFRQELAQLKEKITAREKNTRGEADEMVACPILLTTMPPTEEVVVQTAAHAEADLMWLELASEMTPTVAVVEQQAEFADAVVGSLEQMTKEIMAVPLEPLTERTVETMETFEDKGSEETTTHGSQPCIKHLVLGLVLSGDAILKLENVLIAVEREDQNPDMWLKFQLSASFPLPLKPPDPRCCLVPGSLNDYSFLYMVGVFSLILTRCNKLGTSPAPPPKPPDPSCYLIPEKEFQLQTNKVWLNRHIRAVLRNHAYEVSDKRISKISCYLELLLKPKLIVWRSVTIGIAIAIGCLAQFKETIVTAIGLYTLDSTNQKYFFKCSLPRIGFSMLHMVQSHFSPLELWLKASIRIGARTDAYEMCDKMLRVISCYLKLFHCYWFVAIIGMGWMLDVSLLWFIESKAIGYNLDSKECSHEGYGLIGLLPPSAFPYQLSFLSSNSKLFTRKKDKKLPFVLINDSNCKPIEIIVIGILVSAKFDRIIDALRLLLLLNIAFSTITYDAIFYYGLLVYNFVELPLKIITQPKVDGPVNCDEVRFVHQDMMRFTGLQLNDVAAGHNISLLQFKSAGIYEIVKQTLVLVDPTVASIGNNLDVHGFNISFGAGAACLENYAKKSFTKVVHRNSDIFGSAMQKPFYLDQVKATFIVLLPCYIVCVMDAYVFLLMVVDAEAMEFALYLMSSKPSHVVGAAIDNIELHLIKVVVQIIVIGINVLPLLMPTPVTHIFAATSTAKWVTWAERILASSNLDLEDKVNLNGGNIVTNQNWSGEFGKIQTSATWLGVQTREFRKSYFDFNLEDKVYFKGGSIVTSANGQGQNGPAVSGGYQHERAEKSVNRIRQMATTSGVREYGRGKRERHPNTHRKGYHWVGSRI